MIGKLFRLVDPADRPRFVQWIVAVAVFSVLQGAGVLLAVPILRPLLRGDADAAMSWIGVLVLVTVAACAVFYLQAMLGMRIGIDLLRGLHHRVGDHLAALPLGWFSTDRTGRLTHSLSHGTTEVIGVPAHLMQPVITGVLTPLIVAVGMVAFDWRLGVAVLVAGAVLLAAHRAASPVIARYNHLIDTAAVESASRTVEFARAQPVLRAFGRTVEGHAQLDDAFTAQRRAVVRVMRSAGPALFAFAGVVQAAFTALVALGVTYALGGSLDAATLVALLVLVTRFTGPLIEIADLAATLRLAEQDLDRIVDVLDVAPLPEPAQTAKPIAPGSISFDGVRFGYDNRAVLDGVGFDAKPGTLTAIVGPSGAGKTTILRLIARFWDVDAGTVRVGGVDVRDQSTETLMGQLSLVFQDVYLFDDTIEANIRLGRPDATTEEVREAARLARVDDIVDRLPDGWHTRVGEGGAVLSGGERQRVSIARALLKPAPIVLLDEATAALDPDNETAVTDALHALAADRTLIVVAHRMQTVTAADQILVLDEGRVVARGRHEELITQPGRYADFWRQRQRAQGWRLTPTPQ